MMQRKSDEDEEAVVRLLGCWAKDKWMRRVEAYLKRGRPLKDASTAWLVERWISLITRWTENPVERRDPQCDEIEYEMELRGKDLPYDLFVRGLQKVGQAGREELERQKREEPELYEERAEAFRRELERFVRDQDGIRH